MSGTFQNRLASNFASEINEANDAALRADGYESGLGPYIASYAKIKGVDEWAATAGFTTMVNNSNLGRKFKWTLNTRGDLGVVNPTLKHAVAAGGGEVWTAGHGWKSGTIEGKPEVTLNNDTGHYWASEASLIRAKAAWEFLGYSVKTVAFVDPKKALNKLF